jgi:hypothetical protein
MEGTPLVQVWDGQILDYEYFALVKDGPGYADGSNRKAAELTRVSFAPDDRFDTAFSPGIRCHD